MDTAIEIGDSPASVVGESAAVVIDPRVATFDTGDNGSLVARWLILDSFADGENHRCPDLRASHRPGRLARPGLLSFQHSVPTTENDSGTRPR